MLIEISFRIIFSETILFSLNIFYAVDVCDLIRQFVPKIYYYISKKIQLVDRFSFEICLESKFLVREKIVEISTMIRNSIDYFESFNKITFPSSFL